MPVPRASLRWCACVRCLVLYSRTTSPTGACASSSSNSKYASSETGSQLLSLLVASSLPPSASRSTFFFKKGAHASACTKRKGHTHGFTIFYFSGEISMECFSAVGPR